MLSGIVLAAAVLAANPTLVKEFDIKNAAFSYLLNDKLYVNAFGVFQFDQVYTIEQSQLLQNSTKTDVRKIPGDVTWPNGITSAPASLFGKKGVVAAGGFLTPFKGNGGIWFSPLENGVQGSWCKIYSADNFFYHRAEFYDVDGDGKLDILTCRARKEKGKDGFGDLVWLKQTEAPWYNIFAKYGVWKETVIGKGCDTNFRLVDVNGDGKLDILASEFWGKKVTLIQSKTGRFNIVDDLIYTTIDDKLGPVFDVELVDVNGDGKLDILATNHEGVDADTRLVAYEIPSDVTTGTFIRHDLGSGFKLLNTGPGQAAPGGALVVRPKANDPPHIVLAGDASYLAYLFTPTATTIKDWTFNQTTLHDCGATVGYISVGDTNNDGRSEVYVPCYETGKLAVYTF